MDDMESRISALEDLESIRQVIQRYARGIDRGDWELVRGCFTDDATDDHGPFQGPVDNLIAGARGLLDEYSGTMHLLGQVLVDIHGDEASSETYAISIHRHRVDGVDEDTCTGLRYLDRLVRRGGRWLIHRRITVHEWSNRVPVREWLDPRGWVRGRSDRLDRSYELGLPTCTEPGTDR